MTGISSSWQIWRSLVTFKSHSFSQGCQSGLMDLTVNQAGFALRRFESYPLQISSFMAPPGCRPGARRGPATTHQHTIGIRIPRSDRTAVSSKQPLHKISQQTESELRRARAANRRAFGNIGRTHTKGGNNNEQNTKTFGCRLRCLDGRRGKWGRNGRHRSRRHL